MGGATPRGYYIDPFRVDLIRRQVVAADGSVLALAGRAYDVLVYLIENRERIVSKDDLLRAVWPNVVVEENNLNQAVSAVRRALGDQRDAPRFIATIAGRGYRFVANVVEEALDATPVAPAPVIAQHTPEVIATHTLPRRAMSRRALVGGLVAVVAAAAGWQWQRSRPNTSVSQVRSIAVLPFQPLVDGAAEDAALQLGMADALINRLSTLPGITVAPFSSVRAYTGRDQDPLAAGRTLDVTAVLESTVQVQADRIRVTARLLNVEDGTALWSGRFDERLNDFFAVQDALAQQVVDALEVQLTAASRDSFRRHETDNVAAWQLYLEARFQWGMRTEAGLRQAIELYRKALELDPEFALAAVGLADTWAVMAVFGIVPPGAALNEARQAAQRAITLDGALAEAQAALGHVLVQADRNWRGGEALYRRALKLKPAYGQAVFWLANNCCYQGRLDDALAYAQQSQSLEPLSVAFAANVGLIQYYARQFDDAQRRLAHLVETVPQYALARRFLARVLMTRGDADGALALLAGHENDYAPGARADLGRALAIRGDVDGARREIARVEELGARGFGVGNELALIHAALGSHDDALSALERGASDGSQTIGFLNSEPGFDAIRQHDRFKAVSRKLGLG